MPLKLDIKRKFSQRSDRVKGVDLHPTEPWILANLYNGHVCMWNHADGSLVKSFEAADLPARCAKFVARKQWVIVGSDDMHIRVYNYNTMDKVKTFEAHSDYIRSIAVHPTLPYILSASDDMLIKLWDWDKNWTCTQVFEGHSHYVMQVVFNPKDTNTFASASLDRSVKVWSIGQPTPNYTLEGHEKGVNTVDYYTGGDRPYLITGADDKLCKVWDYQTKSCVQTLDGHSHNISAVCFHPELPIIITGSEDGTVKIWHNTTYRLENTLNYGMERVWALGHVRASNALAIGFDEGCVMIKLGSEEPVASMDASGKIIYARHSEIQAASIKALGPDFEMVDGDRLPLPVKDLGSSELFPSSLQHNSNGRFVVVCGDGEYIVYTALAWRSKSFGNAADFVWSSESNDFATREANSDTVKIHKNFRETGSVKVYGAVEGIHGGAMLGVRGSDYIAFYDWTSLKCVRRIEVTLDSVIWSDAGDMVALITPSSFYILKYNKDLVDEAFESGSGVDEDGVEDAFESVNEIEEVVRTGLWVGDCFIYNNAAWRLNYCVGGEVTTMYHLDRPMYLLGYMAAQQRVYLIDKELNIVSYTLLLSLVEFKTLVMREDTEAAFEMLEQIPEDQHDGVAKFLETRGFLDKALEVAKDPEYRFELAVQLDNFDVAISIAEELSSDSHWKQLGEMALADGRLALAETCLQHSGDVSGMLLMYSATGNRPGMQELCKKAMGTGKTNVAFLANFLLQNLDTCIDILITANRVPDACFFARTYRPSRVAELVTLWQSDLKKVNPKAAEALASPEEYPNLFPDFDKALRLETALVANKKMLPASAYPSIEGHLGKDLMAPDAEEADAHTNGNGVESESGSEQTAAPAVNDAPQVQQVHAEEESEEEIEVEVEVEEEIEVDDDDDLDLDDEDDDDEDPVLDDDDWGGDDQ